MEQRPVKKVIRVKGMTCSSCELRIENALGKIDGVMEVKAIYSSSNVYVTFDAGLVSLDTIIEKIKKLDYEVLDRPGHPDNSAGGSDSHVPGEAKSMPDRITKILGIVVIIFSSYVILKNTFNIDLLLFLKNLLSLKYLPQLGTNASLGLLFLIGLLTSFHCVGMCGGITLSQCVGKTKNGPEEGARNGLLSPALLYNCGRVLSYTVIGGIAGGIGSAVSFSGVAKGIVAIIGGLFMIIMGINMLGVFPVLRKINIRMPKFFGRKLHNSAGKHGSFYIGLLNGLMPCGPLQMMQFYALGTGSVIAGASSMLLFSLGTVPLLMGLGTLGSLLSARFTHRMMKASAALVLVLGIMMMGRGLSLSGVSFAIGGGGVANSDGIAKIEGDYQVVTSTVQPGEYSPIIVQRGIPVKWTIKADKESLNGCNNAITVPKYNIQKKLAPGDNLVEFTPQEEGNIVYTCWMGMISSNIKVVSDVSKVSESDLGGAANTQGYSSAGGCCADGAKATKFLGGKIPTDEILVARIENNKQEVTIKVNDEGYSPAVVVLQKGVEAKIKFNCEKLNSCNNIVIFPEYRGQLNLKAGQTETPYLKPQADFTFQCSMGMLHGYVKVVDDISKVDLDAVRKEAEAYKFQSSGGGGCCG